MRRFLAIGSLAGILVAVGVFFGWVPGYLDRSMDRVTGTPPFEAGPDAEGLHATRFVVDLHGDALLWKRDPLQRQDRGRIDLPHLAGANAGLQVFSAVTKVSFGLKYEENPADSDQHVGLTIAQAWPSGTWLSPYGRARHQARRLHRVAERSGEGEAEKLDSLFEAGYRMAGLTHFFDNVVAGSAHGGVKAICPGPRNLSDAQLEGIAATGGVVGVEHVAVGSDFDGAVTAPVDVTGLPLLTEALLAEGFDRNEVARIMGGNALRVLDAALPSG